MDRYGILFCKLLRERLYSAAAVLVLPRTAVDDGGYREVSELKGPRSLVTTLAGHVAGAGA